MKRAGKFLALASLALVLAGCTQKSTVGTATVASYQGWVAPVSILVGLVLTLGGFAGRSGGIKVWIFTLAAGLGTVGFAPFGFFDKAVVDQDHLETSWGIWLFPTTANVKFDNVAAVTLTEQTSRTRRGGKRTSYYFNFQMKSGSPQQVSADNSLMEEVLPELGEQLKRRNIPVTDQTTH